MLEPPRYRVCRWSEHQHYSKRDPPWIKLHRKILTSHRFIPLPDATKAHYLCLLMLASGNNGEFVGDAAYLKHVLHATDPVDLSALERAGLIEVTPDCKQTLANASNLLHRAEQSRAEKRRADSAPVDDILGIVNEHRTAVGLTKLRGDKVGLGYVRGRVEEYDVGTVLAVADYAPADPWIADGPKLTLAAIFSPKSFPALLDRMENPQAQLSEGDRKILDIRRRLEGVSL